MSGPDRRWSLTRKALERLLQRLGSEPNAAAREYEFLRGRLTTFFSSRRVDFPESLADETLDRVARRLEAGEVIEHVRAYVHGVAHRVALEWGRRQARVHRSLQTHLTSLGAVEPSDATEARAACLETCLSRLPPESRRLLQSYYDSGGLSYAGRRKLLAQRLGISCTSLKVRVHRVRVALHSCLEDCLRSQRQDPP